MAWAVVAAAIGLLALLDGNRVLAVPFFVIALAIWFGGWRFAR
jgi:hypothetical protein